MARNVRTTYYGDKKAKTIVKINRAQYADKAILHAVSHMHQNTYGAFIAEVYDEDTSELYSVITRDVNGRITIVFSGDPKFPVCITDM